MQTFKTSPREGLSSLWRNRELIKTLVQREVIGRYRGSVLGIFWSFFHPLFMLAVYTFVFSVVFQARWGNANASQGEFALVLFAGLIVFNFFSECVNRAPSLILNNPNYVKKVIFPLEILPWIAIGSALFHGLVSLLVWLIFYFVLFGIPSPVALLFPAMILPLILLTVGFCWFLAALGVYVRDTSQLTTILTTVLMFLSPIFYPASALPEEVRFLLLLNPLAPTIEHVRGILIWNTVPDWNSWIVHLLGSLAIAYLGFAWFQKTRRGFADVI